jgi:hypothetical protein
MSGGPNLLVLLERVHGHLGVLGAAALLHPAILLWRGRPLTRRLRLALGLGLLILSAAFGLGLFFYGDYRELVKRDLFAESPMVGLLFETKEHLSYAAFAMAWGATVAAWLAPTDSPGLRRAAARVFAAAFVCALVVVVLGVWVASTRSFGAS